MIRIITIIWIMLTYSNCRQSNPKNDLGLKNSIHKVIPESDFPKFDTGNDPVIVVRPTEVDTLELARLSDPLKAIAIYYLTISRMLCDEKTGILTIGLEPGHQVSKNEKILMKKYLPKDSIVDIINNAQSSFFPYSAARITNFEYLTIINCEDTIIVDYSLQFANDTDCYVKGPDYFCLMKINLKHLKETPFCFLISNKPIAF
jgi:hypothetical protein